MAVDNIYTVSLLHNNGANGSTTFTDESGKVWTAYGNAQISTAQYKFGGASAYFDGSGDYLTTPATTDFQFGSNDFTIDFWLLYLTAGNNKQIFQMGGVCNYYLPDIMIQEISTTQIKVSCYVGSSLVVSITSASFTASQWHHFAFIRSGNNFYLAVDGALGSASTYSGALDYDSSQPVMIGYQTGQSSAFYYDGYIDEFRVSKGIARWTSNFTPPTSEYRVLQSSQSIWIC